jgi:glucuronosyltransferase
MRDTYAVALRTPGEVRRYGKEVLKPKMTEFIVRFLQDNEVAMQQLESIRPDVALVDGTYFTKFKYLIAHRLNIPVVSLINMAEPLKFGFPWMPSFVPLKSGALTDRMTFLERLKNSVGYLAQCVIKLGYDIPEEVLQNYKYTQPKGLSTFDDIVAETKIWLLMSSPLIDYPVPLLPNMVEVGGINTVPSKALTSEWQEIVQKSTNGIVVVSFGSVVASFPQTISRKLLDGLGQLEQTVIMRFQNKNNLTIPRNVIVADWIPQNDLLDHATVMVTHGGHNGIYEALYHAVPLVVVPILADGFFHANCVVRKGYGLSVDIQNLTAENVFTAINDVAHNRKYQDRILAASRIFHDAKESPAELAASQLELVAKHDADHLKSSSVEMPLLQLFMLDVGAFILVLVLVMVSGLVWAVKKIVRISCRAKSGKEKEL